MWYWVVSPLLGTFSGGLAAFAIQSYFLFRGQNIARLNDFISDIDRIESLATKYWSNDTMPQKKCQKDLAVQIRGTLHRTTIFLEFAPRLLGQDYDKFLELDGKLFDSATGNYFETLQQKSNPELVTDTMQESNEIRSIVRNARLNLFFCEFFGRRCRRQKGRTP